MGVREWRQKKSNLMKLEHEKEDKKTVTSRNGSIVAASA